MTHTKSKNQARETSRWQSSEANTELNLVKFETQSLGKSRFARFFALANLLESPKPLIRIECEEGREEWIELHEEHPVLNDRLPTLSPFKW